MNLSEFLGASPALRAGYADFYLQLWRSPHLSERLLELCRLRIAMIHECQQELSVRHARVRLTDEEYTALAGGDFAQFELAETAALVLAEQIAFAHAQIDDAAVERIRKVVGNPGTVTLLTALAFFDVTCRWKLVMDLSGDAAEFDGAALC